MVVRGDNRSSGTTGRQYSAGAFSKGSEESSIPTKRALRASLSQPGEGFALNGPLSADAQAVIAERVINEIVMREF